MAVLASPFTTTRSRIAIACCIDEQYALPLVVMLTSLVERLQAGVEVTVYLMHRRLSRQTRDIVAGIVDARVVRLSDACIDRLPRDPAFPPEAAAPLLLPDLLPADLERVIFLDADMLVMDDIAPLWTIALEGRALGAVADAAIPRCQSARGVKGCRQRRIPAEAPYFNAGMMLVDLSTWRRRSVAERAIEYMSTVHEPVDFAHQEALNAVAWDDWLPLARRWNVPSTAGRWFDGTDAAAAAAPAIVHFAGRMKPWRMQTGGGFATAYADVLTRVSDRAAGSCGTWRDRMLGWYDRTLRSVCHSGERWMWSRRML